MVNATGAPIRPGVIRVGRIRVVDLAAGRAQVVRVGHDGSYLAIVQPGRYLIQASTDSGRYWCRTAQEPVELKSSRRGVDVLCPGL
jgi:hypothetical protein